MYPKATSKISLVLSFYVFKEEAYFLAAQFGVNVRKTKAIVFRQALNDVLSNGGDNTILLEAY